MPKDAMLVAKPGELAREVNEGLALVLNVPIEPGDLAVLAIGVVVAALRAAELVAGQDHRGPLREQQRRHHVPNVDRQQLDGSDAERLDVVDHRRLTQAGVGTVELLRDLGVALGEAFDVRLVGDHVVPGHTQAGRFAVPVEALIDDDAFGDERRAVALVEGVVVRRLHLIAEHGGVPRQIEGVGPGVGVEQKLIGVEAVARLRLVGTVNAVAVEGARMHAGQVAVKDLVGVFGQPYARHLLLAVRIEEADLDFHGVGGEQGEVRAPQSQ